jgi:hypothetical protein
MSHQHNQEVPAGSISLIVTPQSSIHPAARAVAEMHLHRVRPQEMLDLFDRVVRAWRTIRATGNSLPQILDAMRTEDALPSQWLRTLSTDSVASPPED